MSVSFNIASNAYINAAKFNNAEESSSSGGSAGAISGSGFSNVISNALGNSFGTIRNAEETVAKSLVKQADITDVVTAITKAEVTLKAVMEVRDKLVAAHQEISRMPI